MEDPRHAPIYTASQVANLLGVHSSTVAYWAFGLRNRESVIVAADRERRRLSFVNLLELHVLATIRRQHAIQMNRVRTAIAWLASEVGADHPLESEAFATDGVDLFVERYGATINASQNGQMAMSELIRAGLQRIERDEQRMGVRLFPFTRSAEDLESLQEAPRAVVVDPRIRFGEPYLASCGVDSIAVWERYEAGDSMGTLADEFGALTCEIEEAIRFHGRRRAA